MFYSVFLSFCFSTLSWSKEDEDTSNSVLVRAYPRKIQGISIQAYIYIYYLTKAVFFNLHNRVVEHCLYNAQAMLTIYHRE